jgi:hypothetical protein
MFYRGFQGDVLPGISYRGFPTGDFLPGISYQGCFTGDFLPGIFLTGDFFTGDFLPGIFLPGIFYGERSTQTVLQRVFYLERFCSFHFEFHLK